MFMLNPARFTPFDPESAGSLQVWFDLSDASTLTVSGGVITDIDNKAVIDSLNDAVADDGATAAAGLLEEVSRINSLNAGFSDDSPKRGQVVRDNTQDFTRPDSAGFRIFFVIETADAETFQGAVLTNGIRDTAGGGLEFRMNFPNSGDLRWALADISTSGHATALAVVDDDDNNVNDGSPHVIMIGRSLGTGTAGVDELIGSVDGVVPTGLPFDLDAGFGSVDNTGGVNAVTGWLIMGASGAAPAALQAHSRTSFGELLMYHTDMTSNKEAEVVAYLTAKWGV